MYKLNCKWTTFVLNCKWTTIGKTYSSRGCPKQVILSHAQLFEQQQGNNDYFQDQTLIVKLI